MDAINKDERDWFSFGWWIPLGKLQLVIVLCSRGILWKGNGRQRTLLEFSAGGTKGGRENNSNVVWDSVEFVLIIPFIFIQISVGKKPA